MRSITVAIVFFLFLYLGWLLLVPRSPCDKPIRYAVVQVDAGFDVNVLDVSKYAADAAALWNRALGHTVLQEGRDADVLIRLVFEQRQRDAIQASNLEKQVQHQQQDLAGGKESIDALQSRYQQQSDIFRYQQQNFREQLEHHNRDVDYWNQQGGVTEEMALRFNQRQHELEQMRADLDQRLSDLRAMERRLSLSVEQHNQMVDDVNQVVSRLNQRVGEEFEGGHYDPKTQTITIYHYRDVMDLKRVLAHELGHALALPHVNDPQAIMYYLNASDWLELAAADVAALRQVCRLD